jgi:hypothetical protein
MRLLRFYCSILLGVGFTAFAALTQETIWWLTGIMLLPGVVANGVASVLGLPQTYGAVLVLDAILYSLLAAAPVYVMTAKTKPNPTSMQRFAGLLTVVTVALIIGGWFGARWLDRIGHGPCQNSPGNEIFSPNGDLKAVIFDRDCGATTDTAVNISIVPHDRTLNHADVANVFVADSNHGASSLSYLFVDWKSNDAVMITYPRKARVFRQEMHVENVTVSYLAK